MAIIDYTYFINEIRIPNNDTIDLARINEAISRYESDVLKDLLGSQLYAQFMHDLSPTPPQYVTDLINGADFSFTANGIIHNLHFDGLKGTNKKSLLAFFVYCKMREDSENFFSGVSQQIAINENAQSFPVLPKLVKIWNRMVDMYGKIPRDAAFKDDLSVSYSFYNTDASAYNFILSKNTDAANANLPLPYENWIFTKKDYINEFGI